MGNRFPAPRDGKVLRFLAGSETGAPNEYVAPDGAWLFLSVYYKDAAPTALNAGCLG